MTILDTATGGRIVRDFSAYGTEWSASQRYNSWASDLSVSNSESVSAFGGTAGFWMIDLGFAPAKDGTCTKIGFSYRGALSLYYTAPTSESAAAVTMSDDSHSETAAFTSASKPSILWYFGQLGEPTKTQNCKWQTATGTAILYFEVVVVSEPTRLIAVAVKLQHGALYINFSVHDIIADVWPTGHVIQNQWTFNQSTGSGGGADQWTGKLGANYSSQYFELFAAAIPLQISGHIYDETGEPCARQVFLITRQDWNFVGITTSDAQTGAYQFSDNIPDTECVVIAFAEGQTLFNDQIIRVIPA